MNFFIPMQLFPDLIIWNKLFTLLSTFAWQENLHITVPLCYSSTLAGPGFPRGANPKGRGTELLIWPFFPENYCMKLKNIVDREGGFARPCETMETCSSDDVTSGEVHRQQ